MGSTDREGDGSGTADQSAQRDMLAVTLARARIAVGLGLTVVAGLVLGRAWTAHYIVWWCAGGISLALGLLLVVSGIYAIYPRRRRSKAVETEMEDAPAEHDPTMPMLGALLVYKYQVVTEGQLQRALDQQRRDRRKPRLGDVLVEMELVTKRQLDKALEDQQQHLRRQRRQ